jgi:hypothetical protein
MKLFILLLFSFSTWLYPTENPLNGQRILPSYSSTQETVYICDGKYATKYHQVEDCRGLSNCKAEILSIDKKDAIKKGREECAICY